MDPDDGLNDDQSLFCGGPGFLKERNGIGCVVKHGEKKNSIKRAGKRQRISFFVFAEGQIEICGHIADNIKAQDVVEVALYQMGNQSIPASDIEQ